ncbi:hypothetical protein NQ315_004559 [Exocentrus adspersus]|uniref:Chitin-binding type-2 domain-containing protein n=1 Tax=Exocentrus adspersus TaxID=1586481 RepID=A0AAV8VNK7_9CUCU|nr:hypothetical protein NQ315_004559 [Exocentrus adspersus]
MKINQSTDIYNDDAVTLKSYIHQIFHSLPEAVTTTIRPKPDTRFRFVSRKPILRTTPRRKETTKVILDQVSESSNQQSLEEDFDEGRTTELADLALVLQNLQYAPLPSLNSSSSTLKIPFTTQRINSKATSRHPSQSTQRVTEKKPTRSRIKYSTTVSPLLLTTVKPLKKNKRPQAFDKINTTDSNTFRPLSDYNYYDSIEGSVFSKIPEHSKVLLHSNGVIECLDQGNFPHPVSCKKFISCAKMENGKVLGWEYTCPKNLSFDPIGGHV